MISRSLGFGSLLQLNNEYGPDPKRGGLLSKAPISLV